MNKMKNEYFTNSVDYDIIKGYAIEKKKAALKAIEKSLIEWANGKWPKNPEISNILKYFRKAYIQNDTREIKYLENWECGIPQIIDIRDESVCSLLPYLLTAYIYNFPHAKFVTGFLALLKQRGLDREINWITCKEEDFGNKLASDESFSFGIGNLFSLTVEVPDNTPNRYKLPNILRTELSTHANRFCFPDIHRYPDDNDPDLYHLILTSESLASSYEAKAGKGDRPFPMSALVNGDPNYDLCIERRLFNIFLFLYGVSSDILKNKYDSPDSLYNSVLIINDLNNQVWISHLKAFLENESQKDITDALSEEIYSVYEQLCYQWCEDSEDINSNEDETKSGYCGVITLHKLEDARTERKKFLAKIEKMIPWEDWKNIVQPHYTKEDFGYYKLELMLRLYILQFLYNLSAEETEAEVIDSRAFSDFCRIHLSNNMLISQTWNDEEHDSEKLSSKKKNSYEKDDFEEYGDEVPDGYTIERFHNLLVKKNLQKKLFAPVCAKLDKRGLVLKKGMIKDPKLDKKYKK